MRSFILYLMITLVSLGLIIVALIAVCNYNVEQSASHKTYADIEQIPAQEIGLLLGTSKQLVSGYTNLYFTYRVEGAAKLYHAKKIKKILVSGDHGYTNYNEPLDMQQALVELGVPLQDIILDYAGFRTLDSVNRAKEIFGQTTLTIISQEFHNQRAIYIANYLGMQALGYNVQDVNYAYGFKTLLREKLARVKVVIDKYTNKKPKFLGEKIPLDSL